MDKLLANFVSKTCVEMLVIKMFTDLCVAQINNWYWCHILKFHLFQGVNNHLRSLLKGGYLVSVASNLSWHVDRITY